MVDRVPVMEFNGLPLHPLVVHAAVIFGPLAALAGLLHLVPSLRAKVRWPMVVLTVVGVGALVVAYLSGGDLLDERSELGQLPQVQEHEDLGTQLLWIGLGFGAVALLAGWLSTRTGAVRVLLDVLLAVASVVLIVWVFRTGEAGARAVWG